MKSLALAALAATASATPFANWNGTFTYAPTGWGTGTGTAYSSTWANATSCNATTPATTIGTTIWAPTTVTMTTVVYESLSSAQAGPVGGSLSSSSPIVSTTTVEYTVTTTMTVLPEEVSSQAADTSSYSGPYPFFGESGSVHWLSATPDPTKPIVTTVQSVTFVPIPGTPSESDSYTTIRTTSTLTNTLTVTPTSSSEAVAPVETFTAPPITSTTTSMSPELTTTLFSTQYSTISLSRVSLPTSFAGTNTGGWNATSSQPTPEQSTGLPQPITTTETELIIMNVSSTAATSTLYLTTTIGATVTQTFYPSALVSADGSQTALTGEPLTLTHTVQSEPVYLSTSVTLEDPTPGLSSSSAAPAAASSSSPASGPVSITSTMGTAPTAFSTGASANPASISSISTISSGNASSSTCTSSKSKDWTVITLTSFVNGQGTTFTTNSTTIGTIPMSPGFNSTSSSTPASLPAETTSVGPAQSSTTAHTQSSHIPTQTASIQPAATSGSSSVTTRSSESSPSYSRTTSTSMSSHTSHQPSTTSTTSVTNSTTTRLATLTISSSSFINPFLPHSATATPSAGCGEQGDFTMDFDDLPRWTPTKRQSWNQSTDATDIGQYPPVTFNGRPYHHLYFSDGYVYAPKPAEPYTPSSPPYLAAFAEPMRTGWNRNSTGTNNVEPGEFGGAFNDDSPAFWFDAQTANLGCDNPGPVECTIEATAYAWDPKANDEMPKAAQNFTIPPCSQNCSMESVVFPPTFRSLSGIQFRAIVDNEPRTFYADDLNMRWSDDSCDAGMRRQRSR